MLKKAFGLILIGKSFCQFEHVDLCLFPMDEAFRYLCLLPHTQYALIFDRNGYLPLHNPQFSKPKGSDPDWNAANCRDRTFRPIQTTIVGIDYRQPVYLLTRQRNLGGEKQTMIKISLAPIWIHSRHWGFASIACFLPLSGAGLDAK